MADVFSERKRSEIMSRIRSKNTGIERTVFSYLKGKGIYFRKHYSRVRGRPDVALPRKKIAVFIDGDFWHGWQFPRWRNRVPQRYWREKIQSNITRDGKNIRALRRGGWRVARIWGHQLARDQKRTLERVANLLAS